MTLTELEALAATYKEARKALEVSLVQRDAQAAVLADLDAEIAVLRVRLTEATQAVKDAVGAL